MEIGIGGAKLSLEPHRRTKEEIQFLVRYQDDQFSGYVVSSNYIVGSPAPLFRAMADAWRGWDAAMEWNDLERTLSLHATCDSVGHVTLRVEMIRNYGMVGAGSLRGAIVIEAGQLDAVAKDVEALFG